ncbi:MAG: PD-(D/E)XK nuclease family protein [Clostridia bacterium]|nr:PD-(D/E)XK nuclease family protein [Clostridia bacterium]
MLYLVLGREGTGKTHYAHRLLSQWVKERQKQGVLLVPRQFSFESDRGILHTLGPRDACEVDVLSFSRLADVVFQRFGGPKKPVLRAGADAAMMALAIASVQDRLRFFARHRASAGFVQKMLEETRRFKQNKIAPAALAAAAETLESGYLKEKAAETALIMEAYDALTAERFCQSDDVLDLVCEKLRGSDFFRNKLVVIDDFSCFSAQEYALIEQMLLQAADVYVTLCCDSIDNRSPVSPFALTADTARRLRRLAERAGVPFGGVVTLRAETCGYPIYAADALRHLERQLYAPRLQPFTGDSGAVTFCLAPSVREECDNAAMEIRRLLRAGRYRCRDIAVVYRDEEPYAKQMRLSLKKCGVPVFEDRRAPIRNEPIVIFVRALLELCAGGFTTENLMRYLKTGLCGVSWDEIAELENYALMWDLSAKDWAEDWTNNPDGFGVQMNDRRKEKLRTLNDLRRTVLTPLVSLREDLKGQSARNRAARLYRFLLEQETDKALRDYALRLEAGGELALALEQGQVWDLLMEALDTLAGTAGDAVLPFRAFCDLFDLVVGAQSLGKLPDGFDEVYLCDAPRIGTQMPKVVFALGLNAGVFPRSPGGDRLLGRSECDRLRAVLPDLPDDAAQQTMTERYYIYNTLCSARERLYLSRAQSGRNGEKLNDADVVLTLKSLFPDAKTLDYGALPPVAFSEGSENAFSWMAAHWNDNTPQLEAFRLFFNEQPLWHDRLGALARAAKKETFRLRDKELSRALFGRKISLSASRLEKYEECPFQYFCRYGLLAKPRKRAELDPASAGTVVHHVLERLLRENPDGAWQRLPKADLHAQIARILHDYMETYMGGKQGKRARFLYLYDRMFKTLVTLTDRLLFEFSQSSFVPVGFEVPIAPGKAIEPFRIDLRDGYVEVCGVVDRVDEMDKDGRRYVRVVDYKTGVKAFSLSDVLEGLGMQMVLYLVSIWRSNPALTPAGVLYMPARFEPYDSDRADSDETKEAKRMAGGKMEGMILNEPAVLEGMDRSLRGTLLPGKIKKSAQDVSDRCISLTQLGLLAKRMDRILRRMGEDLHDGRVEAKPVFGKNHANTCDWCDYRSVCGREKDGPQRFLRGQTHEEALHTLEEEAATDGT